MKRPIKEGCLVTHEDKAFRVAGVSRDGLVTLQNLETNNTFLVPFTEVALLEVDDARNSYIDERRLAWLEQSKNNPKEMQVAIRRAECWR